MNDLAVTMTTDIGVVAAIIVALIAGWRLISIEMRKLRATTNALHQTTVATNATIEHEKIRNTRIEAKANTAAEKVEAVAVQANANRVELELIQAMLREWNTDRDELIAIKEELKNERLKHAADQDGATRPRPLVPPRATPELEPESKWPLPEPESKWPSPSPEPPEETGLA